MCSDDDVVVPHNLIFQVMWAEPFVRRLRAAYARSSDWPSKSRFRVRIVDARIQTNRPSRNLATAASAHDSNIGSSTLLTRSYTSKGTY